MFRKKNYDNDTYYYGEEWGSLSSLNDMLKLEAHLM